MAKATILLLFTLALIATLLFGINLGKKIESWQKSPTTIPPKKMKPTQKLSLTPVKTATPTASLQDKATYKNTSCGYEIVYPQTWTKLEYDDRSIALDTKEGSESSKIAIVCAAEIPKPPLVPEKIEDIVLSSVAAKLYHDASPKDGTPLDEVITKIPGKNMEIFIAGFGESLKYILSTFRFLNK